MKKILIIVITFVAVTIFSCVILLSVYYSPNGEIPATPALAQIVEAQSSIPGHASSLSIPTLKIKAKIQDVGITWKGNIAAPTNFVDVGWYKYGPLPGKPGTAVIDGHVNNGLSFPGVFSDLKNIKIGDSVYIQTKENSTLNFVVQSIDVYDYNAPTDKIIIKSDIPHLLLITCTGTWVPNIRTHDKRLVVTAVLATQ